MKEDRQVFEKYYRVNTVQYEEATAENCDKKCETFHFCAQHELDYAQFEGCVESQQRRNRSNCVGSSLSLLLIVLSLFHAELSQIYWGHSGECFITSEFQSNDLNMKSMLCLEQWSVEYIRIVLLVYNSNINQQDKLRTALQTIDTDIFPDYLMEQAIQTSDSHFPAISSI